MNEVFFDLFENIINIIYDWLKKQKTPLDILPGV